MRVAIVSDAIYPYNKGGKETRIHKLSTYLAQDGFDVHIYTMKWWDEPTKIRQENGITFHAISRLMPLYDGDRRSIAEGVLFGVSTLSLLKERFDVVDVDHMPYFPLFFMKFVCLIKRKPMIATWHEVWGMPYWRNYLGKAGIIAGILEKLTVLMPTKIIAASQLTADRLKNDLGNTRPVVVIPNGIDLADIQNTPTGTHQSDIIFAGRLLEHKNIDLLLHAVAELKTRRPNLHCFIVGDGPERDNLERLTRKLGLESNVTFWGFLPNHTQVYAFMKASKVFVSPSTREGFGISVLEANACGLPVVVIDHPANAATNLVTQTTGRIAAFNPTDLARHIEDLLDSRASRQAISAQVAPYDWQHAAKILQKVYAS